MKNNSKKNLIASILIKWIDNMDFLNNEGKASLSKFSVNELAKDTEPLSCSIDKTRLSDHLDTLNLDEENKKKIVCKLTGFGEELLPIGSVVSLKNEVLERDGEGEIKIMINNRLLCNDKAGVYFTYSGVIFPSGNQIENNNLYFNKECIKEVCHYGLKDEDEEKFILLLKNEVIFNRNLHSVINADKSELEILNNEALKKES